MGKVHIKDEWIGKTVVLFPTHQGALAIKGILEGHGDMGVRIRYQRETSVRSSTDGGQTWTEEGTSVSEPRSEVVPWDLIDSVEPT